MSSPPRSRNGCRLSMSVAPIQKHFRSFLMTYVDENGQSVYGQRIKHLGESEQERPSQKLTLESTPNRSRSPSSTSQRLDRSLPTS